MWQPTSLNSFKQSFSLLEFVLGAAQIIKHQKKIPKKAAIFKNVPIYTRIWWLVCALWVPYTDPAFLYYCATIFCARHPQKLLPARSIIRARCDSYKVIIFEKKISFSPLLPLSLLTLAAGAKACTCKASNRARGGQGGGRGDTLPGRPKKWSSPDKWHTYYCSPP